MQEETQVVIVGAGPAGLTLGLCLAQHQVTVRSIILEKENEITTDPRGVYLTGDAVRVFHSLGLGPNFADIGHVVQKVNFHKTSFCAKPFFTLDTGSDVLNQALPTGLLQIQPRLELSLRRQIEDSNFCTLRTGCEVVSRLQEDPPTIAYRKEDGSQHLVRAQWLIGADGKVGVVRKHFLEASAGIKQEDGIYRYSGTWVASNLRLGLPTPQTHPKFPLWDLGYTPEQVYDLFWPKGWHFCSPPGKATAAGRFGPYEQRLWRHEFRQEDLSDDMDPVELLWDHLSPMIVRDRDENGLLFPQRVQFPRDCIEIVRCRPFRFVHKVVNKWFAGRTILIGDAAHVFPPFAGQGIGSGIRDAHQLAWRLALLLKDPNISQTASKDFLEAWALERRKSVNDAALLSLLNGHLCNNKPAFWLLGLLLLVTFLDSIPFFHRILDVQGIKEREAFTTVKNGFFLKQYHGGSRLAQIVVQSYREGPILSDQMLRAKTSVLSLLVITHGNHTNDYEEARAAIEAASIGSVVLSTESIRLFSPTPVAKSPRGSSGCLQDDMEVFWPTADWQNAPGIQPGYDPRSFVDRLGSRTTFALIRPDFFLFSRALYRLRRGLHGLDFIILCTFYEKRGSAGY